MKVAIQGMGMAGSYLARLLSMRGLASDLHLYGRKHNTACGERPCAWGIAARDYFPLCLEVGLDPQEYVLCRDYHIHLDGVPFQADLISFDKPRFLRALRDGLEIDYEGQPVRSHFDRVIVATGKPLYTGFQLRCHQRQVGLVDRPVASFTSHPGGGYSWVIPLSGTQAHVGVGSVKDTPSELIGLLPNLPKARILCACSETIHISKAWIGQSPDLLRLGEAAGLVEPMVGAGNAPAMWSALLLANNWEGLNRFDREWQGRFGHFDRTFSLVRRLAEGGTFRLTDLPLMRRGLRFAGVQPDLFKLIRLNRRLKAIYRGTR